MSTAKKVAFLGLGVMGAPMAGHLARAGHTVTVYNRTAAKADAWVEEHGGNFAATPAEAADGAGIVLTCVGNDDDLRDVVLGDNGALAAMQPGTCFVDHTTVSAQIAREIAAVAEGHNILAVDAPVSGGQAGAENGKLAIMCGGSADAMAEATPVMEAYAARIVHVGGAGAGQTTKMVNQTCIAGILAGLSEAVQLAQASDLDMDKVMEAISGGAAQSWQMENRWATMAKGEFDFGFAIDWMRKDLAITLGEASAREISLPVTALVDQFYARVQSRGGGRLDTSALIKHLGE